MLFRKYISKYQYSILSVLAECRIFVCNVVDEIIQSNYIIENTGKMKSSHIVYQYLSGSWLPMNSGKCILFELKQYMIKDQIIGKFQVNYHYYT